LTVSRYKQTPLCYASVHFVYDRSRRRYAKDKLSKKPILPHLETPKDIASERGEQTSVTKLYYDAKFHADRPDMSVPGQKYCPYSGLPWGLPSHALHFWKAPVEPMLRSI